MYLVFYSELTAGQLAKIAKKNISTITRNLEKLAEANLVFVSKTESKGNLQIKYWALNPEVISLDTLITNKTIDQLIKFLTFFGVEVQIKIGKAG